MTPPLSEQLKLLIIESCDRDCAPGTITDDEPLFGPEAPLQLDSLDALQISMALKKQYGIRLGDSKETRRVLSSVATLAAYLADYLAARDASANR